MSESPDSRRTTILVVGGTALAGLVIALIGAFVLLGGDDETDLKGTCQGASYELGLERDDDNRMTGSLEVKAAKAGEDWTVRMLGNGKAVVDDTRTSDDEAEVDVDAFLGTGEQAVTLRAEFGKTGADNPCTASLRLG